jgi:hypothetical protein
MDVFKIIVSFFTGGLVGIFLFQYYRTDFAWVVNWIKTNKDIFEILKNVATIMAMIVGAIWGYMLFVKKRQKYPCANISHQITHRSIDDQKFLLNVEVLISNVGTVLLSLVSAEIRILQVLPPPRDVLYSIQKGIDPVRKAETEVQWPMIASRESTFQKNKYEIEPCEQDHFSFDFIIDKNIQTIQIYTFVRNEIKRKREIGWSLTTFYDLHPPKKSFFDQLLEWKGDKK